MFKIVESGFGLCHLFGDCRYGMFEKFLEKIQFPVIVYSKQQNILTYLENDDDYTFCGYRGTTHYTESCIRWGIGINYKMLMFNDANKIYKINYKATKYGSNETISNTFYGININEIISNNAKILIFMNAINDNNSNIMMLNYDIINYILSFYGPFTKKILN